jgi:myo-inositol-1(or 4)-monophosphatase
MNNLALQKQAEKLVRKAGEIVLSYRFKEVNCRGKKDGGLVTDADLASEEFLIRELGKLEPSVSFFSEEEGELVGSSDYCWVIDPLDGTTNFAYGLPHFCISVALTYKKRPILGFVYEPVLDKMFFAQQGKGSFLDGSPLRVSQTKNMNEALLLFCIPRKDKGSSKLFEQVLRLSQKAFSIRLLGAAALDQSYVGAGHIDGMFFEKLSWWDVAAGSLIIQEAGGVVSDYTNNPLEIGFNSLVAGNPWIHEQLIKELSKG